MKAVKKKSLSKNSQSPYAKFEKINGSHPFKKFVPDGYVDYPARLRRGGHLAFFNFDLAKEMGLISVNHPNKMNKDLEKTILDTFGIVIINEYDQMNSVEYPKADYKKGQYMATRYLQLQHTDKTGKHSGDGRSIWNGQISFKGKKWDISSCGTGATRLSPATSKYNKFFKTGDPSISYGCGYAELDEGMATALMSHIFNSNNIATEQTLAVIKFEDNYSVNVRVHQCLLRPSHFFGYLKQGDYNSLRGIMDYYISHRYPHLVGKGYKTVLNTIQSDIVKDFAQMAARFEDDYIFCWLDWDGDNILMDGAIIDYGSVRQFGLFHYEYRYDDVDRYSTNLLEQKDKAKYIVQTFIQMFDFLKNKKKRNITDFKDHKDLKSFEIEFEKFKNVNLLKKIGLSNRVIEKILPRFSDLVSDFRDCFSYFERVKSKRGLVKVSDGVTWNAIFCMRDLLRELPQIYLATDSLVSSHDFIDILKSNYAKKEDLQLSISREAKIKKFQELYWNIIDQVCIIEKKSKENILLEISMRSSIINKAERITGDSITHVTDMLINRLDELGTDGIYDLFQKISEFQNFDPLKIQKHEAASERKSDNISIMRDVHNVIQQLREGI